MFLDSGRVAALRRPAPAVGAAPVLPRPRAFRPSRQHRLGAAALALLLAAASLRAQPAVDIDLPAQPLESALPALARQAGISVAAEASLLVGRRAPAVRGRVEAAEALRRLLAGSGLQAKREGGTWIVQAQPSEAPLPLAVRAAPPADATQLPPVSIASSRLDDRPAQVPAAAAGFGDQTLLDTPYSVSVIGSDQLAERGVVTIEQALKYVPGASQSYASGAYNYFIVRGNIPAPLLDGSPLWGRARYSLENIERIEFLKGPAALRGGFGGPGGAVNLVTKRPTRSDRTTVGVEQDSWGDRRVTLDASRGSEDGRFGARINLAHERLDDAMDLPGERRFAALATDLRATDSLRLHADLDYLDDRRLYAGEYNVRTDGTVLALDPKKLYGQPWSDQHSEAWSGRVGADWDLAPDWTARLQLGGYRYRELWNATYMSPITEDGRYDLSWYANRGLRQGLALNASLYGKVAAGGLQHAVTVALQHARTWSALRYSDFVTLGSSRIDAPVVFPRRRVTGPLDPAIGTRETSLVVTDEMQWNAQWSLLAGGRYSRYWSEQNDYRTSQALPVGALLYKPWPELTTYLSYAASLEPGRVAPDDAVNRGEQLPARHSEQVELGAKWSLDDGRLLLSAAAFSIGADYYGYLDADGRYVQDGVQKLRGAELEIDGRVAPGWRVEGGVSWLRDILQRTGDAVQDGRQSPGVPRQSATLTVTHEPAAWPGVAVTGGLYHTGRFTSYNYDLVRLIDLPSVTTVDAGLRYRWKPGVGEATVRLLLTNLFDRRGWQPQFSLIAPRSAKLSLEWAY